jgi:hypothetical protein
MESKNRERKLKPWSKIWFFGDSQLYMDTPVIWFSDEHVVCDYSECGLYIASKHMDNGNSFVEITLKELFDKYELWTPITAENNGIAKQFIENNIMSLQDLLVYLLLKK